MALTQEEIQLIAAETTRKIREEIAKLRIIDFGEVQDVITLAGGLGHQARVKLAGVTSNTLPLNCLIQFTPTVGDWVMVVYPQGAAPVIIGKCPV